MRKPIIGLTMGDAAGIGPEIIIKVFQNRKVIEEANIIVIGDKDIIDEAQKTLNTRFKINAINYFKEVEFKQGEINVYDLDNLDRNDFALGKVDKKIGKAAVEYLIKATDLALSNRIDAITSAPLNKEAMQLAGYSYAGQTELLASLTKTKKYGMLLIFGPIKMAFVTNHVPLKDAIRKIKKNQIFSKIEFLYKSISEFGYNNLPIAVAGLNPHAGENGTIGYEEIREIEPAIVKARSKGINVIGPLPADTLFIKAKEGNYSGVLVMYHDQGNIAAKLLNFGSGVTYVSGLPIIRTSVAHGTAFDIAGKGIASPDTLIESVKLASKLAVKKIHKNFKGE